MVPSKFCNKIAIILAAGLLLTMTGCNISKLWHNYDGPVKCEDHSWLKNRKIFIDPGHGGKGDKDPLRVGYYGVTEEAVNLRVAVILEDMLKRAGASVFLTRHSDKDIPLKKRVAMAEDFEPDLLISIHHNGSPRRVDDVNYPVVIFWGAKNIRPASYDFAQLLFHEFQLMMKEPGHVVSDFAIFNETGTRILRETKYLCPGVIGEAGFFSHKKHAMRLKDAQFNRKEAEAYFYAISNYFKRGQPRAEALFSCSIDNTGHLTNMISDRSPLIAVRLKGDTKEPGILDNSFSATLDGIPIRHKKLADDLFLLDYGKELYPGGHMIQFRFKNKRQQSSMVSRFSFTVEIQKGDYDKLVTRGEGLLRSRRTAREGLKMLLSALSMGLTDPCDDKLIWNIARGFSLIGDRANARYYRERLFYFYPQSNYGKRLGRQILVNNKHRFPREYHGRSIPIIGEADIARCSRLSEQQPKL